MVAPNPYGGAPAAPGPDAWDLLGGGGLKTLPFNTKDQYGQNQSAPVGTSFIGRVAENVVASQVTNYDTKEPEFWADGRPKMQVSVVLDTNLRDDEEDDGRRSFYFKNQGFRALQDEMKRVGVKMFGIGTVIQITLVDLKMIPQKSPQKIYAVTLSEIQPFGIEQATATAQAIAPADQPYPPVAAPPVPPQPAYVAPQAPAPPQQQYVAPAQPTFPGPVVPAAPPVPTLPPQAPAPAAPAQDAPPAAPPAPQAPPAPAAPPAAPAAPAVPAGQQLLDAAVASYHTVTASGIDPQTAIAAVAAQVAPGDTAFQAALTAAVGS